MPACPLGVPVGLTIPEEKDEVFGLAYPGLDLEGCLDGCGRLLIPEGRLLLLRWDRAAPISPSSPAPASLGQPHPRGTCSMGIPMQGPPLTWTEQVRVLFGAGGDHAGLHPLPSPGVLGQRRVGGRQKQTRWGVIWQVEWDQIHGGVGVEATGSSPRLPEPSNKQESDPTGENWLKGARKAGVAPINPCTAGKPLLPSPNPPCGQPGWYPAGCPTSPGTPLPQAPHCSQPGTHPHPCPHLGWQHC